MWKIDLCKEIFALLLHQWAKETKKSMSCPYVWRLDVWRSRDVSKEVKLIHWLDVKKKMKEKQSGIMQPFASQTCCWFLSAGLNEQFFFTWTVFTSSFVLSKEPPPFCNSPTAKVQRNRGWRMQGIGQGSVAVSPPPQLCHSPPENRQTP